MSSLSCLACPSFPPRKKAALPPLGTASPSQAGWVGWCSRAFPKGRVLLASSPWGTKGREGEQDPLPGTAHLVCRQAGAAALPGHRLGAR